MKTNNCRMGIVASAIPTLLSAGGQGVETVNVLVTRIKSKDNSIRGPAWQTAGSAGAPAVRPLAEVMMDPDFETARGAKRALYRIVRHAGRPGAKHEAEAVSGELVLVLGSAPARVRREAVWMLSEIAGDKAVAAMAALLADPEVREDARCALMRLSGRKATSAFKSAFANAPQEFKYALAEALRERGVKLNGYPSQKLVPSRKTTVGEPPGY
jgi:HEAT repeat protein